MAGQVAARDAGAGRALSAEQWTVVHTGPQVKCCILKFVGLTDTMREGGTATIEIYVDGDQAANKVASLAVGQSTEVCGKTVRVYGHLRGAQVARWEIVQGEATDWY